MVCSIEANTVHTAYHNMSTALLTNIQNRNIILDYLPKAFNIAGLSNPIIIFPSISRTGTPI